MAEFVWGTDYRQYLQNQAYVNDIRDAQRSAARDTISAIGASSRSILLGVEARAGQIADAHRKGAQVAADAQREAAQLVASAQWEGARMTAAATEDAANRIVGAIDGLDSTFRWGFGQVVGTLGGMSTSLAALVKTARTPAQTAAYEQFEIARDAFRKSLYPECLEALGKAISGDHTSPGYKLEWRFHHLAGVVRLGFPGCDVSLVDPAAAEQSFLLATRYARVDAPGDAARALFSAGWAAFVQNKLPDALQHTEGAIAIDARFAEALFQSAKVRMALGDPDAALPSLRLAIDVDRGYALRAAGDDVFRQHSRSVDAFLDALRDEKARALQAVARARPAALAPLIANSAKLAGHATVRRLTKVAEAASVMGLMDLLRFEKDFEQELSALKSLFGKFRWVRPGTFTMGGCTDAIIPQTPHDVTIMRPFLMQATPVTQAQWESTMGNNPSTSIVNADHPVDNVSWFDAIAYCNALSRNEGLEEAYVVDGGSSVRWKGLGAPGYRLPTEAEWEYACRAGTTDDRYGDLNDIAWYGGNSGNMTHRVGQKLPNPWGFFDMLGNVFEWCWDWYDPSPQGAATDPAGPAMPVVNPRSANVVNPRLANLYYGRVTRGGAYGFEAKHVQAGQRFSGVPGDRHSFQGFRPVRSCDQVTEFAG